MVNFITFASVKKIGSLKILKQCAKKNLMCYELAWKYGSIPLNNPSQAKIVVQTNLRVVKSIVVGARPSVVASF